jgi:hypothetical protein
MDGYGKIEHAAIDEVRSWTREEIRASLRSSGEREGPVIMAAGLQDSSRLISLLERELKC